MCMWTMCGAPSVGPTSTLSFEALSEPFSDLFDTFSDAIGLKYTLVLLVLHTERPKYVLVDGQSLVPVSLAGWPILG